MFLRIFAKFLMVIMCLDFIWKSGASLNLSVDVVN